MTGTCKYCGQVHETFVPEEIEETQENLDRLATEQCDCEKAEKAREKRQAVEKSKTTLEKMLSKWPEAAEEAKTLVNLVSKGALEMVTLKVPTTLTFAPSSVILLAMISPGGMRWMMRWRRPTRTVCRIRRAQGSRRPSMAL